MSKKGIISPNSLDVLNTPENQERIAKYQAQAEASDKKKVDAAKIFGTYELRGYRGSFVGQRKRTARKLQNPRINQITFHTFRHWKATMEYHKTKDILYVMKLLGHKSIKNTLIYTQLIPFTEDDGFVCKVAKTVQEASVLIENGFEYICAIDDAKLFKKRK
jgi:integrase